MPDFKDRAVFWVGAAAVLGTIAAVPLLIGIGEANTQGVGAIYIGWIWVGAVGELGALIAFIWAVILQLAHGHAATHTALASAQTGKGPKKEAREWRKATDIALTWLYRRANWAGLTEEGRSREPAPWDIWVHDKYAALGLSDYKYEPPRSVAGEPGFVPPAPVSEIGQGFIPGDGDRPITQADLDHVAMRAAEEAAADARAKVELNRSRSTSPLPDARSLASPQDWTRDEPERAVHQLAAFGKTTSTCTCGRRFETGVAFNRHVATGD